MYISLHLTNSRKVSVNLNNCLEKSLDLEHAGSFVGVAISAPDCELTILVDSAATARTLAAAFDETAFLIERHAKANPKEVAP